MKYFLLLAVFLGGCATSDQFKSRNLYLTKSWIRNTHGSQYLGPQILHNMAPLLADEFIYQGNSVDGFVSYHRKNGKLQWRKPIKNGVSSGAAISENKIFFGTSDGQFYCLNRFNGETLWTFPVQSETLSAPHYADKKVFVLTSTGILYALDSETGKVVWSYNRREKSTLSIRSSTSPVVEGNLLYAGFSDGFFVALGRNDGGLKWEKQLISSGRFRDVDSTPVISDQTIYISSYEGNLFALDKTTGKTLWSFDQGSNTSVTIQDDRIYYSGTNGVVYCLDKKTGKEIWNYKTQKGVPTQPSYYKEMILFGESTGSLVILNAQNGEKIQSYTTGEGISARPVMDNESGLVYFMSNHGLLYSIKLEWKRPQQLWPWENSES